MRCKKFYPDAFTYLFGYLNGIHFNDRLNIFDIFNDFFHGLYLGFSSTFFWLLMCYLISQVTKWLLTNFAEVILLSFMNCRNMVLNLLDTAGIQCAIFALVSNQTTLPLKRYYILYSFKWRQFYKIIFEFLPSIQFQKKLWLSGIPNNFLYFRMCLSYFFKFPNVLQTIVL